MSNLKILYVCQEIEPYTPATEPAARSRVLLQAMQERGGEIRTFMPRYGCINERRNQLHEVIRLSGMNLIIDDNDHQLIIKVASIPATRVQIYFIDNDDYFARKAMLYDGEGRFYADNDERAIFFARGVLETVRKLRWKPDVIHCHGWFSSIVPVYVRNVFNDDPLLTDSRIVVSLYDDGFPDRLDAHFAEKIVGEGVPVGKLAAIADPSYENLMKFVMGYADGVIVETDRLSESLSGWLSASGKTVLPLQDKTDGAYLDQYYRFYESLCS